MKDLEWIIIKTNNYSESRKFYSKTLNLPVIKDIPAEEFTQFLLGNCYLAIYGTKFYNTLTGKNAGKPGSTIFTFSQVSDVDSEVKRLETNGVKIIQPPKTQSWGQRTAYFSDPDGYIWEIQKWLN
jgi:catechol 2,3-dioxygenase-like lactoylglutathione lyase family enzyme